MGGEVSEVWNTTDVLTILRIIFETRLETVQSGNAKKVHFRLWSLSHSIQNKPGIETEVILY